MKRIWGAHVRTPKEDELSTPLESAYAVIDHQRLWNETFSTPIKD